MLGSWYIRASPPSPAEQAPGAQCTTPTHQRQQQQQPQIQMQMQIQPQPQQQSPPREQQLERVVVQNHATSCSTQSQAQAPVTAESRGDITMTTGANDATPRQPPPKRLRSPPANETEGTRVDHSVQAPPLPPPSLSCAAILGEKVGGKEASQQAPGPDSHIAPIIEKALEQATSQLRCQVQQSLRDIEEENWLRQKTQCIDRPGRRDVVLDLKDRDIERLRKRLNEERERNQSCPASEKHQLEQMRSQLQEQKIAREAQLLQQAIQRKEAEKTYQELCAAAEKKAEAVEAESAQMVQKVKQMERSVQDTLAAIDEVRQKCAAADELKRTTTKELTETQARIDSLTKQIAETQQATTKFTAKLDTILSVFNKNE